MAGARLGPYRITSALGAGGMGEVYKARDVRLDRDVAIKVLASSLAADARFKERFEREARVVASLNHPHICTLYDVGEHRGLPSSSWSTSRGKRSRHGLRASACRSRPCSSGGFKSPTRLPSPTPEVSCTGT